MNKTKLSLMLAASMFACAGTASASDVDWVVAPYFWIPNIDGDVSNFDAALGGNNNGNGSTNIMNYLVWGFMVHTQAQGEDWGVLNEITYADLTESNRRSYDFGAGAVDFNQTVENQDWIVDLAVVWSPNDTKFAGFEPYAGIRYLDVQLGLDLKLATNNNAIARSFNGDGSWTDFLIGAKYTVPLNEKWALNFRGDYSFGDTEGTWLLAANAIYATKTGAWAFGYRYMGVEIPIGNTASNLDLSLYGPQVGYAFKF
ncbi:MAG: hypothetical protein KA365_06825 [Arenimonas sp.]|nr:hypothetical protein [Arenimonas sp.]